MEPPAVTDICSRYIQEDLKYILSCSTRTHFQHLLFMSKSLYLKEQGFVDKVWILKKEIITALDVKVLKAFRSSELNLNSAVIL